jgi:1-acyl-sn-glycerol-3-phosphate acyltransferase
MWDELKAPIVPFITFGAFDLYPRKSWVNQTGRVVVRYLRPIYPSEASSKEEMLYKVRVGSSIIMSDTAQRYVVWC